jgi:putative ABC transport system permease protein
MQVRHIALASLKRRRSRFVFMLLALALAVGTVVALVAVSAAMQREVSDELDRFGANIIVTPRTQALDLGYGTLALGGVTIDAHTLSDGDAERIRGIHMKRNINAVAPKLLGTIDLEGRAVFLVGARFREERRVKSWWEIDGTFARTPGEIMLGTDAASLLDRRIGDTLAVAGAMRKVTAIVGPTGSIDDRAVFVDLDVAGQALGRPGAITYIDVSALCRDCPIGDIVNEIAAALPHARVAPIRQAVAARERGVQQFRQFGYVVAGIVLFVGGMVVLTTMMGAVMERTQEIGILRAVGFRRTQVGRLVVLEALAVNAAGGLLGWLIGSAAATWGAPRLLQLSAAPAADYTLAVVAVALGACIGIAGGAYPAWRATRLDPSLALRQL